MADNQSDILAMKAFAKIAAFGAGSAIGIIILGELINLSLAISAKRLERL